MGKMVEANFALPLKLKGREKGEFLEIQRLSNVYIYVYSFLPVEIEGNDVPRILRAKRRKKSIFQRFPHFQLVVDRDKFRIKDPVSNSMIQERTNNSPLRNKRILLAFENTFLS